MNPLSTDITQPGDRFQARVLEAVTCLRRCRDMSVQLSGGKVRALLSSAHLRSDRIDNRATSLAPNWLKSFLSRQDDTQVDREGGVRGNDSTR